MESITKDYGINEYRVNDDYLDSLFSISDDGTIMTTLLPMAMIVLVIIIVASVSLIYNAFGMSLNERVRYLGMLASVGATKRQKRASIYYEGLILGAVGIPVGIGAGISGIAITLNAIGDKIISTGMLSGAEEGLSMHTVVPLWAMAGIVIVSAVTIFISAFVPAKKASSVTPIEALRETKEIKLRSKKLRSPKIVRRIFGYEGELAYKNLKRNGRKSRIITFSIAISVILFLSVNSFCELFVRANDMQSETPYQLYVTVMADDRYRMAQEMESLNGVDDYYLASQHMFQISSNVKSGDNESIRIDKSTLTKTYEDMLNQQQLLFLNIVDDDAFNKLCEENSIDSSNFYTGGIKAVVMNNISHKSSGAKVFNDSLIGSSIEWYEGDNKVSVTINGFVDYDDSNYLCLLNLQNTVSAYVPESVYYSVNSAAQTAAIGIVTDDHSQTAAQVSDIVDSKGFDIAYISDMVESMESMNTVVFVIQVFCYGFIVLITMITIANIINTVSTGISLRRKEFAMLRSVGTTPGGFRKMISLESLFYGLKALIFALPISAGISFALTKLLDSSQIPFEIDWLTYLMVTAAVFVIVGFSMLYSVSKLKNDSIVETLKEDIN